MSKFFSKVAAAALLTAAPGLAFAQGAGEEDIVVTATRIPTELSRVGDAMTIITSEQLLQRQTTFVSDALAQTPSIALLQYGPRGTTSTLLMRGQPAEGALVLIDGIEVSDPSQSQTQFDFSQLLAGGVDRIEILRGTQSVLYGSDAVGGVVSITTRRGSGPLGGSITAETGSYETDMLAGEISGGAADDRLGYALSVQYLNAEDQVSAVAGGTEGEAYENFSSNGRLVFDVSDNAELNGAFRYAEGARNFDGFPDELFWSLYEPDTGDDFKQYSGRIGGAVTAASDSLRIQGGVSYSRTEREGFSPFASGNNFYTGQRTTYDAQVSYAFNADNILLAGLESEEESLESDNNSEVSVETQSLFLLYQTTLADALTLSAGARLDDHETFGEFDTYRATAAYQVTDAVKLRGSYATAFRAPSLFELYGVCCGDPNLGNPDLTPEESTGWDIGADFTLLDDALTLKVTHFETKTENKIVYIYQGFPPTLAPEYYNVEGETIISGLETEVLWRIVEPLTVSLSYTHTDIDQPTITLRPENLWNLNINYVFADERANLNVNVLAASDIRRSATAFTEDYTVANVSFSFDLTEALQLRLRVENVADEEYETRPGYNTSGTGGYIGLRAAF